VDARHKAGHDERMSQREIAPMYHFTALATCLAILLYFYTCILVSKARGKFGVKLPAISGNPDFERVFRVQMNTLEWMPIFLPSLWLFAIYVSDAFAGVLGGIWIIGRVLYVIGYSKATEKRGPGFAVQFLAAAALWLGALGAIMWRLVHA
jgi:glutathione S-transferase